MIPIRELRLLIGLLLPAALLAACAGPATPAVSTPAPDATQAVAAGSTPTVAESQAPTETEAPTTVPTDIATPTDAPTSTLAPTDEPERTATREPDTPTPNAVTPTATRAEDILEEKWFADTDGNVVPDFLETELGADPLLDECAVKQCGEGAEGLDLLLKERNILLVLDSSGSMAATLAGGETKMDAAKAALTRYVNVAGGVYRLGFLVYGHTGNNTEAGKAESCVGIDLLAPLGQLQPEAVPGILERFQPTGWTPIAAALTKAGEAFAGQEDARNRVILISDGIETCEGDPVAVAQQLYDQGLAIQIDVIGFDLQEGSADVEQLKRIAEVTRGSYYDAKTASDLDQYFQGQSERLGDTYDQMVCQVGNFALTDLCDTSLHNKVQARLRQLMNDAPADSAEAAAYDEMARRISESYEQRQQGRRDAQVRFDELKDQYFELQRQVQRAFEETYVDP